MGESDGQFKIGIFPAAMFEEDLILASDRGILGLT